MSLQPTLPASDYWDPAVYEHERHAVFAREWQCVGFLHELEDPGSYLATTVAGWPVVIVREGEGADSLRAFHNVCRHRAGPVVDDGCGTCQSFVCRYHGWAYGLDGSLRSARDFGADLDPLEWSLHPVRVASWRGLVFVCLADDGPALGAWFGSFVEAAAGYPIEQFRHYRRCEHPIAANWKTYADNYLEGYHIPLVHPALNKAIDTRRYTVELAGRWSKHHAPPRDGSIATGMWLWQHPNFALNLYEHGMSVERWLPTGPTSVVVVLDYFFADTSAAADERNSADIASSQQITDEDRRICEAVQRNLEAGVYEGGVLSPRHEQGVAAFQQFVRDARAATPADR